MSHREIRKKIYKEYRFIYFTMFSTDIESISAIEYDRFLPFFQNGISAETINEFHAKPGKEHFRLLAYLASLFRESTIINIHTNGG